MQYLTPYLVIGICLSILLILLIMVFPVMVFPVLYIIMIAVSYMLYTYYEKEIGITTISTKVLLSVLWPASWISCSWAMLEDDITAKVSELDKQLKRNIMENRRDTVSKLTKDDELIVRILNVGSAWIPKMVGVELIHLPSKTVIRCVSSDNQHANMHKAREMLDEELATLKSA